MLHFIFSYSRHCHNPTLSTYALDYKMFKFISKISEYDLDIQEQQDVIELEYD